MASINIFRKEDQRKIDCAIDNAQGAILPVLRLALVLGIQRQRGEDIGVAKMIADGTLEPFLDSLAAARERLKTTIGVIETTEAELIADAASILGIDTPPTPSGPNVRLMHPSSDGQ